MSVHDVRSTTEGEPTLVVTVRGVHDVYRFADHLQRGQCEFADVGYRTNRYLRRKLGKGGWRWLMRFMHGDGGYS